MIFTNIRLRPFAGQADLSLDFAPGLNTVAGANEAGKSTVFRALESGLLERSDLTPAKLTKFIAPYLPVGGSDTIAVELGFLHDSGQYLLRRQWGATCGGQLTLPDGGLVTAEDEVVERVSEMLGVLAGTCRSILFTPQTVLPDTLAGLKDQDRSTVRELNDLLSATMQETDGSVRRRAQSSSGGRPRPVLQSLGQGSWPPRSRGVFLWLRCARAGAWRNLPVVRGHGPQ